MKGKSVILIVSLLLTVTATAQTSDPATQQDLLDLETRLDAEISDSETAVMDWVEDQHAQTANALRNRIDSLAGVLDEFNTTVMPEFLTIREDIGDNSLQITRLTESNENVTALLALVQQQLQSTKAEVQQLQQDVLDDHVAIYEYLETLEGYVTDENGNPLLPALATKLGLLDGKLDGVEEKQGGVVASQFRVRSDLDNMTGVMTAGFNAINTGQEATFSAADAAAAKGTMTNVLLFVAILIMAAAISAVTKRPRKFWNRIDFAKRSVEHRGEFVEPPCPDEANGLKFGDYHECENRENCEFGEQCKFAANEAIQEAAVEGQPLPEYEEEVPEPVFVDTSGAESEIEEPASSYGGFGGQAHA